ncbi:TetR/AcrR family transcriptional regulator [Sphingobium terrigena]|uniref:TetR/AcrR family transcriptional regulator n=2 Tax=Sphingobium terrigena TaxID=2304063 RepID=A0A418YPL6_9SPHN|nr:TetR/AcrR family transcriptional regulator [Sphingobium terrigena]
MGPAGSDNWHAMLDGAEYILREQGYACLTSRAVAERIGVKQRLVYYYFRTMDELIVETFRRLASRELVRLRVACQSDRPMHDIWDICTHSTDARLITEFMALANHLPPLRVHVIAYIEDARLLQIEAVTAAMNRSGTSTHLTSDSLVLLATGAALLLAREGQLGVSMGHQQLESAITDLLARFEPA